ncbi:hypothetical protein EMMF5_001856 [Cystobasidiomycetes sp. EMM_F5]
MYRLSAISLGLRTLSVHGTAGRNSLTLLRAGGNSARLAIPQRKLHGSVLAVASANAATKTGAPKSTTQAATKKATASSAGRTKAAGTKKATAKKPVAKKPVAKKAVAKKPVVKKAAKPKAPPKPKRVLNPPKSINSSWLLFYTEELAKLPKEERKNVVDLSKGLVERYRALSRDERDNLDRRVAEMRVQYEKDLAEYMSKVTPEMIQAENLYRRSQNRARPTKKKSKLIKDPTKPAAPLNAYIRWTNSIRADPARSREVFGTDNLSEVKVTDQARALAQMWKSTSDAEKAPFLEAFNKERDEYTREMDAWKAKQTPSAA